MELHEIARMPFIEDKFASYVEIPKFTNLIKPYKKYIEELTYSIQQEQKTLFALREYYRIPLNALQYIKKVLPVELEMAFKRGDMLKSIQESIKKYNREKYITYGKIIYNTTWEELEMFYAEFILLLKSIFLYCTKCEGVSFDGVTRNTPTLNEYYDTVEVANKLIESKNAREEKERLNQQHLEKNILNETTTPI